MRYAIKTGNLTPPLELTLSDVDGEPIDLTGCTVKVVVAANAGAEPIAEGPAVVVEAAKGEVRYDWLQGQTDIPGDYLVEATITDENGDTTSVPGRGYGVIRIEPRLGA